MDYKAPKNIHELIEQLCDIHADGISGRKKENLSELCKPADTIIKGICMQVSDKKRMKDKTPIKFNQE